MGGEFCEVNPVKPPTVQQYPSGILLTFFGITFSIILGLLFRVYTLDTRLASAEKSIDVLISLTKEIPTLVVSQGASVGHDRVKTEWVDAHESSKISKRSAAAARKGRNNKNGRSGNNERLRMNMWVRSFEEALEKDWHPAAHVVMADTHLPRTDVSDSPIYWWANGTALAGSYPSGIELENHVNLIVPTNGIYVVYNQITYTGRRTPFVINYPHCGHIVHLEPAGENERHAGNNILYGSTTQYRLGRSVSGHKPHDSVYVSGVFKLKRHDKLSVKLDPLSVRSNCQILNHDEKSFFGMYRLTPLPVT